MVGSSASLFTSMRRECLVSKSKIPPQLGCALRQIVELSGEGVEVFGFHDSNFLKRRIIQYALLVTCPKTTYARRQAQCGSQTMPCREAMAQGHPGWGRLGARCYLSISAPKPTALPSDKPGVKTSRLPLLSLVGSRRERAPYLNFRHAAANLRKSPAPAMPVRDKE